MNDAGKISFLPKGEYDSGAMYEALDVVKYDGMVWAAKKSSKGITPVEGENWMCLLTAADYATADAPGIVKPDGDTIEVSTDATISVSSKALTFADHDTATSGTSFTDAEDSNMIVTDWTKNLLNPTLQTTTQNDVTCTNNGDGTYTINGTSTKDRWISFGTITLKPGKYKFIATENNVRVSNLKVIFDGRDIAMPGDIFITQSKYVCDIGLSTYNVTFNNVLIKPMITTDLSATYDDFVPYSGYEIKSCGKNIFKNYDYYGSYKVVSETYNGYPIIYSNDQWDGAYQSDLILKSGVTYTISAYIKGNGIAYLYSTLAGGDLTNIALTDNFERFSFVYTPNEDVSNIRFENGTDGGLYIACFQIEEGAQATDFEPYTGETITVTNETESPAFGLKSHKGITNIISPGNVKCVYPTNESGKGVLDAMYNNSQLSNELSKLKNAIIAMGGTV